ncbi:MAG: AAA family ATPase [Chloroflexota bacterium]
MWVESLDVRGFKHLRGNFALSPQLTVVLGRNEAGKSTMHEALLRTLFGFSKRERRRSAGESSLTRCRPWGGGAFAINAVVHAARGRLRIEWDFERHAVTLIDMESNEDRSSEVLGKGEDVHLGKWLVDLELTDFREACCLSQVQLTGVTKSETLVVALQRAVEFGSGDSGIEGALKRLDDCLREQIGVRVDNLQANKNGVLATLLSRREKLQEVLARAEKYEAELVDIERERNALAARQVEAEQALAAAEQALLRSEAAALAERLRRAREHHERSHVQTADAEALSEAEERALTSLFGERERLVAELEELIPRVEATMETLRELEAERVDLQSEFDSLTPYRELDASGEGRVRELFARLAETDGTTMTGPPQMSPQPRGGHAALWTAAILVAVASLVGVAVAGPAALAGLLLAAALAYLARKQARSTSGNQATAVMTQRREAIEAELVEALDELGASAGATGATARAEAYLGACEKGRRCLELDAQLGRLGTRLSAAGEPRAEQARLQHRADEIEAELRKRLDKNGIAAADLRAAKEEFERLAEATQQMRLQAAAAEEAEQGYRTALGEDSFEELENKEAAARSQLEAHLSEHGELPTDPQDTDSAALSERRAKELKEIELKTARLGTQIEDREARLADVPAAREELEVTDTRTTKLRAGAEAVSLARDELERAAREARRAFRPHLKRSLDKHLERITGGRYGEAEIDDDLQITVIAPETGRMAAAELLSRGTQDQIYFVERLAIVDLLDAESERLPLFLDEPFAHFDADRLKAGCELVAVASKQRQTVLFTTHPEVVEQVCAAKPDAVLVELEAP